MDETEQHGQESIELAQAWAFVLKRFDKGALAWLTSTKPITVHGSTVMIAVPNDFTRERIESRMRITIEDALSDYFEREMHVAITIEPGVQLDLRIAEPKPETDDDTPQESPGLRPRQDFSKPREMAEGLNARYTFDNFVIGASNRFAHAAAVAVAEGPGQSYNPLVIYGQSGLGKTHLLHAVGHYVNEYYEDPVVKYVSTEELTNEFINAISTNRTAEFRRAYREVDVLLIDDIQFLESKIQTQEEFFHTFNTLHNAQKQIVMTSDRPPKALEALEPRLRSRFEMGLLTDVQPPDLETRIAILKRKAQMEDLTVSPEVLEYIASRIQTNIRELEGALIRATAFASLNSQQLDVSLTDVVLRDLIPEDARIELEADEIIESTCTYFGVKLDDLVGPSRTQTLVNARQIAMYLCRDLTDLSLPGIGERFGGKDHTTVMHAYRKIRRLMSEKRSVYTQVTELTNMIKKKGT